MKCLKHIELPIDGQCVQCKLEKKTADYDLAKQDRDSWQNSHKLLQQAANKHIEELESKLAIATKALEKISKPDPRPQGANDYQQVMYWSGHAIDNETVAKDALSKINAVKGGSSNG